MSQDLLGKKVTDKITGFKGTVIGVVFYLTGCNQALVVPKASEESKAPDGHWYDIQRLEVSDEAAITLDNGDKPGCDQTPPRTR